MRLNFNKNLILLIVIFLCSLNISYVSASKDQVYPEILRIITQNRENDLKDWLDKNNNNIHIGDMPVIMYTVFDKCRYDMLKVFLDRGSDPNTIGGPLKSTLIHNASQHRDISCLTLLLERGASIDVYDNFSRTAYFYAMLSDNKDAINYLYEQGLSLFLKNNINLDVIHVSMAIDQDHLFKDVLKSAYKTKQEKFLK